MVGLFSRFSVRSGHRRAQSALDLAEVLPSNSEATGPATATTATSHGIEVAVEFKPVEHPVEPLDNDLPIQCPLPEPSILHDGRIWKERASANVRRRTDLPPIPPPMMKGGGGGRAAGSIEPETGGTKQRTGSGHVTRNRHILPSISAPEHSLVKLLEESGI